MNKFAKRIIPCLDVKDGRVVKGVNFVGLKDAGDPVEIAKKYNEKGADELCFLDISASHEGRETIFGVVESVAKQLFIPLCVGGGVREIGDISRLLNSGCDKISLNSAAVKNPDLIGAAAEKFGSQCVVVAIDIKCVSGERLAILKAKFNEIFGEIFLKFEKNINNANLFSEFHGEFSAKFLKFKGEFEEISKNIWNVFVKGGREDTGLDAIFWAKKVADLGAGEILLTSMDSDGTKNGFDLLPTGLISHLLNIPVIASGGAGKMDDFLRAFCVGADAALAASVFHYEEIEIADLKKNLLKNGVNVRV